MLITRREQPRDALRAQSIKVIEHEGGELELPWGRESLAFKTFDAHQHLSHTRVADDKLLNARGDEVLLKEAARLRKLQASVALHNQGRGVDARRVRRCISYPPLPDISPSA